MGDLHKLNQMLSMYSTNWRRAAIVCTLGKGVNGLSIVRSLGRTGVPVHVIAPKIKVNLATRSKYCIESTELSSINQQAFLDTVRSVARKYVRKPVLFVDNDIFLNYILADRSLNNDVILTSFPDHVVRLMDKKYQIDAAKDAGLTVPRSRFPRSWKELATIRNLTGKKLLAKRRFPGSVGSDLFKVLGAANGKSLCKKLLRYDLKPKELLVQEYVEGNDDDVHFALCYSPIHSGNPIIVTGRKIVQSGAGEGGVMVVGEVTQNQRIYNLTKRLIQYLNYRGFFGVEFKFCKEANKYFFIEINLRPERINAIGRLANVDLNVLGYLDACGFYGLLRKINAAPISGGVWIDARKLLTTIRRRKELRGFFYLVKSLVKKKEWAVLAIDDLRPFLYSIFSMNVKFG